MQKEALFGVLDDSPQPCIISTLKGIIVFANVAALKLFGYTALEAIGANVSVLCEDSIAAIHDLLIERYLISRRPVLVAAGAREMRAKHKSGALFPVALSVNETDLDGEKYFIAHAQDIRPMRQREEQLLVLQQVNQTLFERTAAIMHEKIVGNVAHEIRNPLQMIRGSIDELRHCDAAPNSARDHLYSSIERSLRECSRVLDDAVATSNYQTRRATNDPFYEEADVTSLLEDLKSEFRFITDVPIVHEIQSTVPPRAFFNRLHTRQVAAFLINAPFH